MRRYVWRNATNINRAMMLRLAKTRAQCVDGASALLEPFGLKYEDGEYEATPELHPADSGLYGDLKMKRLIFWAIRPDRFFRDALENNAIEPIEKRTITMGHGGDNNYELYDCKSSLGVNDDGETIRSNVLRCWCPTTGNEHWILVPTWCEKIMLDDSGGWGRGWGSALKYVYGDACAGAASIVRQGDVIYYTGEKEYSKCFTDRIIQEA